MPTLSMSGEPPQKPDPAASDATPPEGKHNGDAAFSGSKPGRNGGRRLSDEEAFAELQRRQRERARRP
jgi:hypothetical protein